MKEIRTTNDYISTIFDLVRKNKSVMREGGVLNGLRRLVFPKKNIMDRTFKTHNNVLIPILNGVREELGIIKMSLSLSTISIDIDKYLTDVETISKNICEVESANSRYGPVYGPYVKYGTIFGNIDMSTGVNNYKKTISARDASAKDLIYFSTRGAPNERERKLAIKILDTWKLVDSTNAITERLIDFLNSNNYKFRQFVINGYSTVV
jgi:hypothetical protein